MWTREHDIRHEELRALKKRIRDQYFDRPGIVGISVGFKTVGDKQTDELVIRFHVARKGHYAKEDAIPAEIEGVKTDVVETVIFAHAALPPAQDNGPTLGEFAAAFGPPDTKRYDTLQGGMSVGAKDKLPLDGFIMGPGTLGLVVTDGKTGQPLMLSNFHVLCQQDGKDPTGQLICQPDRMDRYWFQSASSCGKVARFAYGSFLIDGVFYGMDAAVASINPKERACAPASVLDVGKVVYTGKLALKLNMKVLKRGRTTKLTEGTIVSTDYDTKHDFGSKIGTIVLYNQIEIYTTPKQKWFEGPGDSGAVYLVAIGGGAYEVVGLNWGGNAVTSVGSPIGPILKQLDLRI
jgi:hypothetical protein